MYRQDGVDREVPAAIKAAEEWRVAGERLHRASPAVFEKVFALLVVSIVGLSDENDGAITESYFPT